MGRVWLEGLRHGGPGLALVYPNKRAAGASNLGLHAVFRGLNRLGFTDIFYTDAERGIRSGEALPAFPILFVSLAYEVDLLNLARFLRSQGIELSRRRRSSPLMIAGGIAASANPPLLSAVFDAVLVGEEEEIIPKIKPILDLPKPEALEFLAGLPFAWVPAYKEAARAAKLMDLSKTDAYSAFVEPEAFFKEFGVEIMRGCPRRCRFCLLGYSRLPPRFVPAPLILSLVRQLPRGLVRGVGLVGSAPLSHPQIDEIISGIPQYLAVDLSSVDAENLTPERARHLAQRGARSCALAPEAGAYDLRRAVNKDVPDEVYVDAARYLREAGFSSLKLYYMVGLPGETHDHITAILSHAKQVEKAFAGRVEVVVSPFIPKPGTPFYAEAFLPKQRYEQIKKVLAKGGLRVRPYHTARLEALLARGDSRLSEAVIYSAKKGVSLLDALRRLGLKPDKYLFDEVYFMEAPWNRVDTWVWDAYLRAEATRARRGLSSPPCRPGCKACGACSGNQEPEDVSSQAGDVNSLG